MARLHDAALEASRRDTGLPMRYEESVRAFGRLWMI
jgi:hypothetical protein